MEEKNNGAAAVDHMRAVDALLDEYEVKIGLPKYLESSISDVQKYLEMKREQMEALDIEDCAYAALILGSFAFKIQRNFNREIARVNWADGLLKKIISGKERQYAGSWDSQFMQAAKEDGYTRDLLKIKNYAQQRADRLTYLSNSIKNISDLFINLQRAKINK